MYEDYLEHHGIKGMKWGVRRTPAQLGHAVMRGRNAISNYFANAKKNRTKARNARRTKSLKRKQAAVKKLNAKNGTREKQLAVKQEMAAAKQRQRELKRSKRNLSPVSRTVSNVGQKMHERHLEKKAEKQENKRLNRLARQQALRNAGSQLLTSTLVSVGNATLKTVNTSITNNDSYSQSVRDFAEFMGGAKRSKPKNSLDLLSSKSFDEMSDQELKDVNIRLSTQDRIENILKKHAPAGSQNGSSYSGKRSISKP